MNHSKRQDQQRQFKVEIFKGIKIIDNENYDFIDSRQFFSNPEDAVKYIEKLKDKLQDNWVIRYFKKIEEKWELFEIID